MQRCSLDRRAGLLYGIAGLLLLLLCLCSLAQASALPVDSAAFAAADYYPFNDGNRWVYRVSGTLAGIPVREDVTCTVDGLLVINDIVTSRIVVSGVTVSGEVGLTNDAAGLLGYGGSGSALWFPPISGYVDPAWLLAPAEVSVGESWTQTVTPYEDGVPSTPVTATTALAAVEDVWVTAGFFAGCLRFEIFDPASPESLGRYWLAPGVGLVRADYSDPATGDHVTATLSKATIVSVALTTNKTLYHWGDPLTVTAAVANDGPWASVYFRSWMELPDGTRYAGWSVGRYLALPQGASGSGQVLSMGALPQLPAGTYTFRAELRDPRRWTLLSSDGAAVVYE